MMKDANPYEICKHDRFIYAGVTYTALADPTGEFNTYVRARNEGTGTDTEIVIRHGNTVTILD